MANVLPNYMLVMHWQRLEILVTDITVVNPVSLCLSKEAFPSLKGISTGFAGVWWWEVHKPVSNKKGRSFQSWIAEYAWCWVFVHLYNIIFKLIIGRNNHIAGYAGKENAVQCPPPPAGILTYPPHPFSSPPLPPPSHHSPSSPHNPPPFSRHLLFFIILLLFLFLWEVWNAYRLSLLARRDL